MIQIEFDRLSSDLRAIAKKIPLHWGRVQNNSYDDNINMFVINSYEELEKAIERLDEPHKNYLRRRWYLWQCSKCDEFLFYCNDNADKNPNPRDKTYDVLFDHRLGFDIKGTVIPKSMRGDVEKVIIDQQEMVDFFYDEQSKGRRYDIQNRLFIVHHSFVDPMREFYLRCAWGSKRKVYKLFCDSFSKINFMKTHNVLAGVIFILERELNVVETKIAGL